MSLDNIEAAARRISAGLAGEYSWPSEEAIPSAVHSIMDAVTEILLMVKLAKESRDRYVIWQKDAERQQGFLEHHIRQLQQDLENARREHRRLDGKLAEAEGQVAYHQKQGETLQAALVQAGKNGLIILEELETWKQQVVTLEAEKNAVFERYQRYLNQVTLKVEHCESCYQEREAHRVREQIPYDPLVADKPYRAANCKHGEVR